MEPALVAPSGGGMWNLLLYVLAVVVGLILIWTYEPKEDKGEPTTPEGDYDPRRKRRQQRHDWRLSSLFAVLGLSIENPNQFEAFTEHFLTFDEVAAACKKAGLKESNLIIGVDFTASNEWQGRKSFNQNCLHKLMGHKVYNPYQKVIWILGQTLAPFDEDNLIPAYGFGDSQTTDEGVFSFTGDEDIPCHGFQQVLDRYNDTVKGVTLSGPTSFAPIIKRAIEIVKRTRKYHILVIIADGQVNEEEPTIAAIVEASHHPLSIIMVGVGDGPWDVMEEFDHRLPKRKFDNFRFLDYHRATFKSKNPDTSFALQALMEIPDQYKKIRDMGYIEDNTDNISVRSAGSQGSHRGSHSPIHSSHSPQHRTSTGSSPRGSPHASPTHRTASSRTVSPTNSIRSRTAFSSTAV